MPDLTPGFFGKLPSHGDFIDRGLDRSFIGCWDAWLARGLAASRQRLAPDWLDRYMVAPIWRFVLGSGICGEGGWQGILMPSVDRVNRHFPLTLALPRPRGQAPLAALLDDDDWFAHCEALALEALTTGMDADRLWQRLAGVPAPRASACCQPPVPVRAWHFALPTPAVGAGLGWCVSEALLSQWEEPCSLWSSTGSDQVEPAVLLHRGLPDAEAFTALLNGDFARLGWHSCRATDAWRPLQSAFYPIADDAADPISDATAHGADDAPGTIPGNGSTGDPGIAPDPSATTAITVAARPDAGATGAPAGQAGPRGPTPFERKEQRPDPATTPVAPTPLATAAEPVGGTASAQTDARAPTDRVGQAANDPTDGGSEA